MRFYNNISSCLVVDPQWLSHRLTTYGVISIIISNGDIGINIIDSMGISIGITIGASIDITIRAIIGIGFGTGTADAFEKGS